MKPCDAESWLHKFTPRRTGSIWSKRNQEVVERLAEAGRLKPAGAREVELAKADGRWAKAYDSPGKMVVPADFLKALARDKRAKAFISSRHWHATRGQRPSSRRSIARNVYAIAWRLQTAKKPATREKRMAAILAMLAAGEKFHQA